LNRRVAADEPLVTNPPRGYAIGDGFRDAPEGAGAGKGLAGPVAGEAVLRIQVKKSFLETAKKASGEAFACA